MASDVAGAHTNGTMEDADSGMRDIKSHLLFEVSTEVANRGEFLLCGQGSIFTDDLQLEVSIP